MTESDPTPPPRDLASEFAALAGLDALDGADAAAMEHCHECPFGRAARAAIGHDETIAQLAAAHFPPVEPPAGLRDKILGRIDEEKQAAEPPGGFHFVGDDEGEWTPLPGGKIRLKVLSDLEENGHTLVLIEADPGAEFFPHAHKGMEEVFLVSGDLETEGRVMGPGDYLRSAPGTRHHRAVTRRGCRALMITARENHPRRALGIYGGIVRSLRSLRGDPD